MTANCPTCGKPLDDPTAEADGLLRKLTHNTPHREVYKGQDGRWYMTYGGGPFSDSAVQWLVKHGLIQSVYSNAPNDAYHVGKTWDYERTMEARKKLGKAAPHYYLGDS